MSDITQSNSLADLAGRITAEHTAAASAIKRGIEHALKAGELLIEAKAKVPHGQWAAWLADNTPLSERSAQRYMQLTRERPTLEAKSATVADLTIRGACELLAKPPELMSDMAKAWRLMPDDGNSLAAILLTVAGTDLIVITPSTAPEYFYVTHSWLSGQDDEYGLTKDGTMTCLRKPARWQSLPEVMTLIAGVDMATAEWWQRPFTGRRDRNPFDFDDDATEIERHDACLAFADAIGFPINDRTYKPWPKSRREFRQAIKREGAWA